MFVFDKQSISLHHILIISSSMSPFARGRGPALTAENDRFRKLKSNTGPDGQQLQWPEDFIRRIKLLGYEDYYLSKILSFYVLWLMYLLLLLPTSSMIHSDIIDHTEK